MDDELCHNQEIAAVLSYLYFPDGRLTILGEDLKSLIALSIH